MTGVALSVALVVPGTSAAFSAPTQNAASGFAAASVFRAYAASVLADAPSFYWRLDETSGTTVSDATGNGRNASADGVTFGRAGALLSEPGATAAGLDGGVILSSGSVASVGPAFSVETWVRTTSTAGGPLVALTNANNNGVIERALYVGNDGAVRFGRSASPRVTGPRVNDGSWHHVVYTNASTGNPTNQRAKLYVDGQLVATNSAITGSVTGYWDAGRSTFQVPALWQGMPDNTFRGDLDEIAVYTDVLSAAEVAKHYTESGR